MARILIKDTWYEQVEPSTFSETEFEDRISLHAPSVYPHYFVVPFKKTLITTDPLSSSAVGTGKVVADLAFIARDYKEWWVVEVEMSYHSFTGHIRPQIQKLQHANYGDDEAIYLANKESSLDLDKLKALIATSPVQVLLIINQPRLEWIKELAKDDVVTAVFELFRSDNEHEIFRVNGEYPSVLIDKVSDCSFHPLVPRLLKVSHPDELDLPPRGIIRLKYNNCVTEWRRIDEGREVFLTAVNRNPLKANWKYEIHRQNDGQLVLKHSITIGSGKEDAD